MKISTQGQSRFLSHDDVREPILATMDRVTEDRALRNPYVLHFEDDQLKPFPLNVTNRRILVAAFGDDADAWHGREIEIYFDPSVPNPRDPSRPGGIKVRVPSHPLPSVNGNHPGRLNGAAPPTPIMTPKVLPKPSATAEPTIEEKHGMVIAAYAKCATEVRIAEWARWAAGQGFAPHHVQAQHAAHRAALERIAMAAGASRRPATARA